MVGVVVAVSVSAVAPAVVAVTMRVAGAEGGRSYQEQPEDERTGVEREHGSAIYNSAVTVARSLKDLDYSLQVIRTKWASRSFAVLLGLVVLLVAVAAWRIERALPSRVGGAIPGLSAPVSVTFDDRGVPRVTARTYEDACRAQGWLVARERMFQMDVLRRAARGELAEAFGKAAVPIDERRRTLGYVRVAEAAWKLLPADESAPISAFAEGVNAWLAAHRGREAFEYDLVRAKGFARVPPRPWTPQDSLLVLLLQHEELSTSWQRELDAERVARHPGLARFLLAHGSPDDAPIVPDADPPAVPQLPVLGGSSAAAEGVDAAAAVLSGEGADWAPASNGWVVSGALTRSGKPILANDPHLPISTPGIWITVRFEIGGRPVEGVALPGLPGIVLGRNDAIAWGFTTLMADVEDLYRESIVDGKALRGGRDPEPVTTRAESIPVAGGSPVAVEIRETSHGPLVTRNLALRWTALDPRTLGFPVKAMNLAETPEAFQKSLDRMLGPSFNVVWASKSGSIGWRASGILPIRRPGTDGSVPYDGRDPENDWRGYLPSTEMPRVTDPPAGFLATANDRTVGTSFPTPVTADWAEPNRGKRIRDLLAKAKGEGRKLDRAAMEEIQLDILSEPLRDLMRALVETAPTALPNDLRASLGAWDGRMTADRNEPLVARAIRRRIRQNAYGAWKLRRFVRMSDDGRWIALVRADDAAFRAAGLGEKAEFLARAARDGIADLEARWGKDRAAWRWGTANALNAKHPLGYVPGLGIVFDAPAREQSGDARSVRAASAAYGQSMRFVVDWGEPDAATLVIPGGVSGHVGSRHRFDQLPLWLAGDPSGEATRLARPPQGEPLSFRP